MKDTADVLLPEMTNITTPLPDTSQACPRVDRQEMARLLDRFMMRRAMAKPRQTGREESLADEAIEDEESRNNLSE